MPIVVGLITILLGIITVIDGMLITKPETGIAKEVFFGAVVVVLGLIQILFWYQKKQKLET